MKDIPGWCDACTHYNADERRCSMNGSRIRDPHFSYCHGFKRRNTEVFTATVLPDGTLIPSEYADFLPRGVSDED